MAVSTTKRALGGSQVEYYVVPPPRVSRDLYLSLVHLYHPFQRVLSTFFKKVGPGKGIKFQLRCNALLEKFVFEKKQDGLFGCVVSSGLEDGSQFRNVEEATR